MKCLNCFIFLAFFIFITNNIQAQDTLPMPRDIQKVYESGTRSKSGSPGKSYWQNQADYHIKVNFEPSTRLISGTEIITYTNNSSDTLKQLWFKLYPNFYQAGAERDTHIKAADITDGVKISRLLINDQATDEHDRHINGTNMIVHSQPLLPGSQTHFTVDFSYTLNKTSHERTGQVEEGSYFVAYFYPCIAVYDDIDGWNRYPYTGTEEFYNDFSNFNVALTVPKDYVVWATGTLQNRNDVLSSKYVQRIKEAEQRDSVTHIIDTADVAAGNITTQNPLNTWNFKADSVTEFVFATSNHYVWNASSLIVDTKTGRRTRVDAAFDPRHKDFKEVVDFARKTVKAMSYTFPRWPYPYPHETIYDGLDQMEYPMMVNDNPLKSRTSTITLTDHEIFHTMFPFYMGVNETKYAWMDEGWATIGEWIISHIIDTSFVDDYGVRPTDNYAGTEQDQPIMTLSTEEGNLSYYLNSYPKPAMGYLYAKDMLGDTSFLRGLHYYIDQWHGKHPSPYDFFDCMNKGSGKNLNWFWKNWFFDNGYPDQAIDKVTHSGNQYHVAIKNIGTKAVPVDITITYADGSTQTLHKSIAAWENNNKETTFSFTSSKKVQTIKLGSEYDADVDMSNNVYEMK